MPDAVKKALFTIKGVQQNPQGENDEINVITQGEVRFLPGGKKELTYIENDLPGMMGVKTRLMLDGESAVLTRGMYDGTEMRFQPGRQTFSRYETPYGSLDISITGNQVYYRIGEKTGKVKLRYTVSLNGAESYENNLSIDIRYQDG